MILVLGSQPAGDVSHKPGSRLPLLFARPAVTLATLEGCYQFRCLVNRGTMGVNSLPKTVTRQRRGRDMNPGPSAPESSTLKAKFHYTDTDPNGPARTQRSFAAKKFRVRVRVVEFSYNHSATRSVTGWFVGVVVRTARRLCGSRATWVRTPWHDACRT